MSETDDAGEVRHPFWILPDGSQVLAPDGLDAEVARIDPGVAGRDGALSRGWIGAEPVGAPELWRILPVVAAPTLTAQRKAERLIRPRPHATPPELAKGLSPLMRYAWDDARYATPEAALVRCLDRVRSARRQGAMMQAISALPVEARRPDMARIESGLKGMVSDIEGLYEVAHGWRYGPSLKRPPNGDWAADGPTIVAGADAASLRILDTVRSLVARQADMRLAIHGLGRGDVAEPPEESPVPGEPPLLAMVRLLRLSAGITDDLVAEARGGNAEEDALEPHQRKALSTFSYALSGTGSTFSNLAGYVESYRCQAALAPSGDVERIKSLASGYLSHECGRTFLELRHRLGRTMTHYLDALKASLDAAPEHEAGARP